MRIFTSRKIKRIKYIGEISAYTARLQQQTKAKMLKSRLVMFARERQHSVKLFYISYTAFH